MPNRLPVGALVYRNALAAFLPSVLGIALVSAVLEAQTVTPASALPQSAEAVIASPTEPRRELKEGKVLRALRVRGAEPVIDGSLSDEVWSSADRAGDFVQRDPDNGKAMT